MMKKFAISNYVFIGTVLEHLDNILFALFLPVLADYFFYADNEQTKWLLAFVSFGLFFVVRPLGALIFGVLGDRYGKKISLFTSVLLMSIGTLMMGILPSYQQLGIISSVGFLSLRVLQGLSVGGEYGAAMTYIYENSNPAKRTFFGSILIASTHLGGVVAALFALVDFLSFRYIFIIVGVIGILSLKGRLSLVDCYKPKLEKKIDSEVKTTTIYSSITRYLYVFALSSCLVAVFYTSIVYFNKIAISGASLMSQSAARLLNIALLLLWLIFSPLVGYIIDVKKLRSHSVMKFASFTIMIFSPAALFYFDHSGYNISMFVVFQVVLTMFHIMFCASTPKLICSLFSAQMRNTNTSVSYAIGSSFTAAAVPFLNDYAFNCFGIKGIGIVIFIFAFIGFLACFKQEREYLNTELLRTDTMRG